MDLVGFSKVCPWEPRLYIAQPTSQSGEGFEAWETDGRVLRSDSARRPSRWTGSTTMATREEQLQPGVAAQVARQPPAGHEENPPEAGSVQLALEDGVVAGRQHALRQAPCAAVDPGGGGRHHGLPTPGTAPRVFPVHPPRLSLTTEPLGGTQVDPAKAREMAEAGVPDASREDGFKVHPIQVRIIEEREDKQGEEKSNSAKGGRC
eukprot:scaffold731_cov261-Pinguiococcus_pyrenoidosus.AAC.23